MTTTPLPPPDTHCFDEDTNMDVWSYSAPLVEQIVKQARADLEAENARLREALDWCIAEINRESPAVLNGRAVLKGTQ